MTLSSSPGESKVQKEGRELDMLIAEQVFGWAWAVIDGDASGERLLVQSGKIARYAFYLRATGNEPIAAGAWRMKIPFYSTKIEAAWRVVEKMRAQGIYVDVRSNSWGYSVIWARAGVDHEDIWVVGERFEDETAPLAICAAALRALETSPSSSVPSTGGEL